MRCAEDEHKAGVNDDLTRIMGTRDNVEEGSLGYGVSVWALDLELGKYSVRLKLQIPGGQEHEREEPAVGRQGRGWEGCEGGSREPRGLTDIASGGAEVVSVANDVVRDVHGGGAGLVYDQALVEAPEHLEGEQDQDQHQAGGGGALLSVWCADKVQSLTQHIGNLE